MLSKYFFIGEITKSHGIKGEIKMRYFSDDTSNLSKLKKFFIKKSENYIPYNIESIRINGEWIFAKLESVDDRNTADSLKNLEVYIDRADASPLNKGEFYIGDAIGAKVVDRCENNLGTLIDVLTEYKTYVYVIKTSKGKIMFPEKKGIFVEFKSEEKILVINEDILSEVGVLE